MKHYFTLLFGLLLCMGGCNAITDHYNDDKKQEQAAKIQLFEKLTASGAQTTALFDSTYRKSTLKVAGVPIESYSIDYHFTVSGTPYTGTYSASKLPTSPVLKISYLPENPAINSSDAKAEVRSLQSAQESSFGLYFGMFLLAVGFARVTTSVGEIRTRKRLEAEEEQRQIDAFNRSQGVQY